MFKNSKKFIVNNSNPNYNSKTDCLDINFISGLFTYGIVMKLQNIFYNIKNLVVKYKKEEVIDELIGKLHFPNLESLTTNHY